MIDRWKDRQTDRWIDRYPTDWGPCLFVFLSLIRKDFKVNKTESKAKWDILKIYSKLGKRQWPQSLKEGFSGWRL